MTLNQLNIFIAVADLQSFSKAGERVSLAQSTISQHIKALEDELSVSLFDRLKTEVKLTPAGKLFYNHAVAILKSCDDAANAIRDFRGIHNAHLRIGASTIPASCLIPDLLDVLQKHYKGITLEVVQGDSQQILNLLTEDKIELALVGMNPENEQLDSHKFKDDKIILVGNGSCNNLTEINITDLTGIKLALRESGSGTQQAVDSALKQHGVDLSQLQVFARLGSSEALRRAVISSNLFAFVSALAVEPDIASGLLREITVRDLDISRSFYLVWKRQITLSPAATAFKNLLISGD